MESYLPTGIAERVPVPPEKRFLINIMASTKIQRCFVSPLIRAAFAAFFVCCGSVFALAADLTVSLINPPGTGTVVALLFDSADAFADLRDPTQRIILPDGGLKPATLSGLVPGEYAVMIFHDKNENRLLDKNFMGIPREPLGFSEDYWAKGSPAFSEASFNVEDGDHIQVEIELRSIFRRVGLIGIGVGIMTRSSPYRGADSIRAQVIPAVTYIGERVQILGPLGQVGLIHQESFRLAGTIRYRLGAYIEKDSSFLKGMGNRRDSMFGGLSIQALLPAGVRVSVGYEHDVFDRVGGGFGRIGVRRGFQLGRFSAAPVLGINWLSSELAGHEYGIKSHEACEGRPVYRPGTVLNFEPGIALSADLPGSFRVMINGSIEILAQNLRKSPLVDKSATLHFFGAGSYTF